MERKKKEESHKVQVAQCFILTTNSTILTNIIGTVLHYSTLGKTDA